MPVQELRAPVCAEGRSYAETTNNGRTDACCAATPAEAQQLLRPIESIRGPEDLPEGVTLIRSSELKLSRSAEYPFGFALHAPREIAQSILRGTTGLCVDAAGCAAAAIEIRGAFDARASRDNGRLRLQLASSRTLGLDASAAFEVKARVKTKAPDGDDELLAALLDTHPLQWARQSLLEIGTLRWKRLAGFSSEGIELLERLTRLWGEIGTKEEAALWKAAGTPEWSRLQRFVEFILNPATTPEDLVTKLHEALAENPSLAGSPALEWLEAVAGERLGGPLAEAVLQRIRAAASRLSPLVLPGLFVHFLNRIKDQGLRETDISRPDRWVRKQAGLLLNGLAGPPAVQKLRTLWSDFRNRAYGSAAEVLERDIEASLSLELHRGSQRGALIDCSFDFTPEGLAQFRRTLEGDLDAALTHPSVHCRHAILTHDCRRRRRVELRLPFAGRKIWKSEAFGAASGEIRPDGPSRLVTYRLNAANREWEPAERMSSLILSGGFTLRDGEPIDDSFSLSYSAEQKVEHATDLDAWMRALRAYGIRPEWPGRPFRAEFIVSVPGEAVTAWASSPSPKDPQYHAVMAHASVRVQSFLRRWLPALYFTDKTRYECLGAAFPLLVYECSAPFEGRRGQYAYDVMSRESIELALRTAAARLPSRLRETVESLQVGFDSAILQFYKPAEACGLIDHVRRHGKNFDSLLIADAMFVDEIMTLANAAREIRSLTRTAPSKALKKMSQDSARFTRAFHAKLHRLYAGRELAALAPLLFVEATAALSQSAAPREVTAELRVHSNGGMRAWRNTLRP